MSIDVEVLIDFKQFVICEEIYNQNQIKYIKIDTRKIHSNPKFQNYSTQNIHYVEITPTEILNVVLKKTVFNFAVSLL